MSKQQEIFSAFVDAIAAANREPSYLDRIAELTTEVELYKEDQIIKLNKIGELMASIEELRNTNATLQSQLSSATDLVSRREAELVELRNENLDLDYKLDLCRGEIEDNRKSIDFLTQKEIDLTAQLEASKGLGTRLQTMINRFMGEAKEAIATLPASEVAAAATFLNSDPVEDREVKPEPELQSSQPLVETNGVVEEVTQSFAHDYVNQFHAVDMKTVECQEKPLWATPACYSDWNGIL